MDAFDADMKRLFPHIRDILHILPHDGRRSDDKETGKSYQRYFQDRQWDNEVVYAYQEHAREVANEVFMMNRRPGEPTVLIDPEEALELVTALQTSVIDEKSGKIKRDGVAEHAIDGMLKVLVYVHDTLGMSDRQYRATSREPEILPGGITA